MRQPLVLFLVRTVKPFYGTGQFESVYANIELHGAAPYEFGVVVQRYMHALATIARHHKELEDCGCDHFDDINLHYRENGLQILVNLGFTDKLRAEACAERMAVETALFCRRFEVEHFECQDYIGCDDYEEEWKLYGSQQDAFSVSYYPGQYRFHPDLTTPHLTEAYLMLPPLTDVEWKEFKDLCLTGLSEGDVIHAIVSGSLYF